MLEMHKACGNSLALKSDISMTNAGDSLSFPVVKTRPFLELPTETRLEVYKSLFISSARVRLKTELRILDERSMGNFPKYLPRRTVENISDRMINLPEDNIAAIMATCHKIFNEAAPVFYSVNTIHHSISAWGSKAMLSQPCHLSFLKSLSLDYSNALEGHPSGYGGQHEAADKAAASFLDIVSKQCPNLEILEFHLIMLGTLLHLTPNEIWTGKALKLLVPSLKQLTITSPIIQCSMREFCSGIAPENNWAVERIGSGHVCNVGLD